MTARESDPFHDDNLTQEEFEAAMNANFPLITIPDPLAVGKWLDDNALTRHGHRPVYGRAGWSNVFFLADCSDSLVSTAETPELLLSDILRKIGERDPLAKLRKEWEALGKPDLNDKDLARRAQDSK